jgi:chromosome partitioning protein
MIDSFSPSPGEADMGAIVALVSQKGGVGKSALARTLARDAVAAGLIVKLADLDVQQGTCLDWNRDRNAAGVEPEISVESFRSAAAALAARDKVDLLILDGPARTSQATLEIARVADVVVQPSGPSADDLRPVVRTWRELVSSGIPAANLAVALNCIGTDAEETDARGFLERAEIQALKQALPERAAYRQALNAGRAMTETRYPALNNMASSLIQDIISKVS